MVKGACFDLSDEVSLRDVHVNRSDRTTGAELERNYPKFGSCRPFMVRYALLRKATHHERLLPQRG